MKKSFTLLEILIVISLIVLLALIALVTLNPKKQIEKGQDTKRKQELIQLSKVIEDYYNDKDCYPLPSEICYNDTGVTLCNICGNDVDSPDFNPYISQLPCDPQQPSKKYLYQVDDISCPSWYRIYTILSNTSDPVIASVGCTGGCGPEPDYIYNYGVSSSNINLETNLTVCLTSGSCESYCNSLGKTCIISETFNTYTDGSCQNYSGYCSGPTCCNQNPIGGQIQSYKCFCQ